MSDIQNVMSSIRKVMSTNPSDVNKPLALIEFQVPLFGALLSPTMCSNHSLRKNRGRSKLYEMVRPNRHGPQALHGVSNFLFLHGVALFGSPYKDRSLLEFSPCLWNIQYLSICLSSFLYDSCTGKSFYTAKTRGRDPKGQRTSGYS